MPREDDSSIDGDIVLYRRIPPFGGRVDWTTGEPVPSSQNFSDGNKELSVHLASLCTPEQLLEGHDGFGVVAIPAKVFREECRDSSGNSVVTICRDDVEPQLGHVLVIGKITSGMRARIRAKAQWVHLPARPIDPTQATGGPGVAPPDHTPSGSPHADPPAS